VAVAPHGLPQRGRRSRRPAVKQAGQVPRLLPGDRLRDHLGGHLTDPGELPQRPRWVHTSQVTRCFVQRGLVTAA
jgi:hypothetical protein